MIMSEGRADRFSNLKPTVLSKESNFGRREGVILGQFEHSMVIAICKIFFQIEETEMKS